MKLVAISQGVATRADRNEPQDTLDQRLCALLSFAGYAPIPVPNRLQPSAADVAAGSDAVSVWIQSVGARAVVLSGGNDIGISPERDLTESRLLAYAKANKLPALGICRGMQMMGTWSGVKLTPVEGHVRTRHTLRGEVSGCVNSYHHFALSECPADFFVTACSEDGSIEAIRHASLLWEGWMWHPEREDTFVTRDIERLQMLFGE